MAKKGNEAFDLSSWLNEAPATKAEKKEKRKAEREEKKSKSNEKANIPTKTPKKNSKKHDNKFNVKYGIFVGACVVAMAGTGFWAWTSHNTSERNNTALISTAKSEVKKAKDEAKKEAEKKYSVTKEDYDNNVKIMVKGIKTLSKKSNGDLTGYFMSNGKYYNVITYDRETGQMYVVETDEKAKDKDIENGKPLTLGKEWINTLIVRLEADAEN